VNGQVVSFGYDALGRRVSQIVDGTTATSVYDGADVVLDQVSDGSTIEYLNGPEIDNKLQQAGGVRHRLNQCGHYQ
jgi:hypothetical protein